MVLALIRSSLACLASRFSHCSKVVGLEVFATRRTQILHQIWEQRTIFQAHLSWFPLFLHGRSVVANTSSSETIRHPLMLSLPSLVFLPSLCVSSGLAEMDPQRGDANFTEVHSKLYDEIMSSIQLVFGHFSDGVRGLPAERLGQAMRILGMNPTEDQDLWPQIEAFVEVLMRKSHFPGPPCDSLVMFGPLNCPFGF